MVKREAEQLREKLELPEDFDVFDSMCADQWEYNTVEDGFYSVSEQRNQKEQRAVEFLKSHGNVNKQIARIERLSKDALDAGIKPEGIDPLLTVSCSDRSFLQGLSDYLLVHSPVHPGPGSWNSGADLAGHRPIAVFSLRLCLSH